MSWLREAVSDSRTNKVSIKRVVMMMSATVMCISVLLLSVAAVLGHSVVGELGVVCTPLALMAGCSYVAGKAVESSKGEWK